MMLDTTMATWIGPAFGWNALVLSYLFSATKKPPREVLFGSVYITFALYLAIWRFFYLKIASLIVFTLLGLLVVFLSRKFLFLKADNG
jgi:hypothetical protein